MVQLRVGETFAGYVIEGVLGQGGMGTVYLARHPRLPRSVALKLLNREVSADEELRRRFGQEADVIARLEHPGIVDIYDRGTDGGHLWIAMQFVEGIDAARLDRHAVTVERALRIIGETGAAIDFAHSRGVLHRDVKPANILLAAPDTGRDERAVLTDFGIARLADTNTQLTAASTFTATLAYASPEQLSGDVIDHRADQYSLACTFFTLVAGRTPFAETNPGQVIAAHLSKPVPQVSTWRPDLPPELDGVIARAMAKLPDHRFASCSEFAAAARGAVAGRAVALPLPDPTTVNIAGYHAAVQPPAPEYRHHPAGVPLHQPFPYSPPRRSSPLRRQLGRVLISIALVAFLVFAVGGAVIALNWHRWSTDPWSSKEQAIADAFPKLVSDRDFGKGWHDLKCAHMSPGFEEGLQSGIHCDDEGINYYITVMDFGSVAVAKAFLAKKAVGMQQVMVSHPDLPTPLPVTTSVPGTYLLRDIDSGFPDDPERGRFVLEFYWKSAVSEQQVIDEFWKKAPLGK
ncbi:serine/threonine protein kinase [Nocardia sp. NBC_00565]|uniref:serine/threonine-protein kinase n=1 Tax=Nocardia sp. NBC_00565 TaxID=2975993 RepID=UPI002E813D47|nr:serine/threonine-protein kinase [Nocardia sp. NBC_00565]WUC04114.1 serine/threonine protein kinase [Nocardia sp. NBC_00565]